MDQPVKQKTVDLLGIATGLGLRDERTALGPHVLRRSKLATRLSDQGICLGNFPIIQADVLRPNSNPVDLVARVRDQTLAAFAHHWRREHLMVAIGGDHSCALGTWVGIQQAASVDKMGLIWIDAHLDSHTPETSLSGALHGMPLASLLGYGYPELRSSAKFALKPENVFLIGIRSYEQAELKLLNRIGVRVFFMDEVKARGIDSVLEESLTSVGQHTENVGISIDLDGIDPQDAPAVSTPVADGIRANDLLQALLRQRPPTGWLAAEIVEFNPAFEKKCQTTDLIADLISVLAG